MPKETSSPAGRKQSRSLWIIILLFIIFVVIVFLTQNKEQIDWKDYQTGIELAKQQNKPALLCFFKEGTRFSSDMWQDVYSRPDVKKYVEANFVPILIDVDKQPEIAKRYNVTYYPTHYVEHPNTNQIDGPFTGAHRLFEFIKKPRNFTR
jgi:thioredoxin-related protein